MKKRILSVLLALVMALSLCTVALADVEVTPTIPGGNDNLLPGTPQTIGASFTLDNFYYGGLVSAADAGIYGLAGKFNLLNDYLMFGASPSSLSYATDWIGSIDVSDHYYLQVKIKINYDEVEGVPHGTTFSENVNDYSLYVCGYDTYLRPNNPPYPSLGIEAKTVTLGHDDNQVPTATIVFPLTLNTDVDYSVDIPLTKNVTKGGNVNAPATSFGLEIKHYYDTVNNESQLSRYYNSYLSVTTSFDYIPGTSDYKITITGPKAVVNDYLEHGFFVREKAHSDTHWACDSTAWFVENEHVWGVDGSGRLTCTKVTEWCVKPVCQPYEGSNDLNHLEHFTGVTFNNVYTKNAHRVPSSATPTAKVEAPKTFDAGIAVYGVSALLSLTGSAWVVTRRRDR